MITILLITDQPRLQSIFASIGELPGVTLRMAGSLDHGAEEITAAAPAIVFVQDRLSGLSGNIIARHIRSRLTSEETKIILLSEDNPDLSQIKEFVDRCLDLRETDQVLTSAVENILAALVQKEENSAPGKPNASELVEKVYDQVKLSRESSPAEINGEKQAAVQASEEPAEKSRFQDRLETVLESQEPVSVHFAETRHIHSDGTPSEPGMILRGERVGDYIIRDEPGKNRFWLFAIASVALVAILFYLLAGGKKQPAKTITVKPASVSAQSAAKQTPTPSRLTRLPAFIPAQGVDAAYAKTHPGWEKYITNKLEFKVYREKDFIKALQVIDLSGGAITEGYLKDVLKEVGGDSAYAVATKAEKGNYLIEKGSISAAGRIITYRDKSSLHLKGFVVHFQ
ncbi:response regulator [Geotalea uraniireducens]|uniref:Response regulatory domain-containing protein n=1 Tax=Geotalea uraniireducens (strain Rf4) TaxID=351605 RepID=A5GCV3_GEOUR|nr:hypothetical protein [Geotalea uraniireducens]ABQ24585.1 hypothetical protein Gura_0369 [Geotalea uraniireducens Rf4]